MNIRLKLWLRFSLGSVVLGSLAISGEVLAQSGLRHADTDRDGQVDYEEFRSHMVDTFYRADQNRDGKLEGDEFKRLNTNRIRNADKNRDGGLDLREFLNATSADFRSADKNRNHVLGVDEVGTTVR